MRIIIDLQGAQAENRFRGIGFYSLSFAQALARLRGEHEVLIVLNGFFSESIDSIRSSFNGILPTDNIHVWSCPSQVSYIDIENDDRRNAAEILREQFLMSLQPDWVIVTSLFEGFNDSAVTSLGLTLRQRTAVVLYDLIPLIYKNIYLTDERQRYWYYNKLDNLRRADFLLAISNSTLVNAVDYLGFSPDEVANISCAAHSRFKRCNVSSEERTQLASSYGLHREFVMYTGGIDARKNIDGLLSAWARLPIKLRQNHHLAIVCSVKQGDRDIISTKMTELGLGYDEVCVTGYVPELDLLNLYNTCKIFVFPSWHEGFGLPILEAMQCGKPVLAANSSSIPEILGRDDSLFDPYNSNDMAACIERALTDQVWREELSQHSLIQAKKFSWEHTARRTWGELGKRLSRECKEPSTFPSSMLPISERRPRLAYISPLPPDRSGIADYSVELIKELVRFYEISVVVNDPLVMNNDTVRAICHVLSVEEFRSCANHYERILYHFGNSQYHECMFDLLITYPGVVVLHDFFLSGVQAYGEGNHLRPFALARSLYTNHGYRALAERYKCDDIAEVVYRYPVNLDVCQQAHGVIVHSLCNAQMAETFYGQGSSKDWDVIPLLREPVVVFDRTEARKQLGLPQNALLVCSFGMIGQTKLNHRLLDSWLASSLSDSSSAYLIFVGDAPGQYGEDLAQRIRSSSFADRIKITGWIDEGVYKEWLAAADIAVQLRALSRGETSAAVLDCLNYGLATIVNSNGSMGELDTEAVWMLPDEFENIALQNALEVLGSEESTRNKLSKNGRKLIRTRHNPRICTHKYFVSIENFYQKAARGSWGATQLLSKSPSLIWPDLAKCISKNFPFKPRPFQLLVDISVLAFEDLKTGIQRVTRSILSEWLRNPPPGFVVEPIYATENEPGYRYARRFTSGFMGIHNDEWAKDDLVEAWKGDVFCGLDLHPYAIPDNELVWQEWRKRGVKIGFVLYDLLPVLLPHTFVNGADASHEIWLRSISRSDYVIGISRSVIREFRTWFNEQKIKRALPLQLGWFHLGADTENSKPTKGMPSNAETILNRIKSKPSFLMVGTVEARKGHRQTLDAFEILWQRGMDINLVIVGKAGWKTEDVIHRIRNHPEQGNRLFWLEGISDEFLEKIYSSATACLMASEGEGFGLPLVEAARYNIPIIARDIPVFREIAGDIPHYFNNTKEPDAIAEVITLWIDKNNGVRKIEKIEIPYVLWKDSAEQLLECILNNSRSEYLNCIENLESSEISV